jgi:uncharacterized membrane protein
MERIPEPDAVEDVPERLRHGVQSVLHGLGDLVERLRELGELLREAEIRHRASRPRRGEDGNAVLRVGNDPRIDGSGTSRLEAFSDGVFAIAATLLVLEFSVSHKGDLGDHLLHLWPAYLAYATSFLTIGIIWMNHHFCVETIARADRVLMFLNVLLLITVSFLPFPTRLVADYLQKPGEQAAVYAYAATFVLMAIIYNVWWRYASTGRRLIGEAVPESAVRAITRAFAPGVPMYGLAFLVAIWSPLASVAVTFAIAAFYLPSAALFDR